MVAKDAAATATGVAQDRDGHPSAPEQQGLVRDQGMAENTPPPPNQTSRITPSDYYRAVLRIQSKFDVILASIQRKIDGVNLD